MPRRRAWQAWRKSHPVDIYIQGMSGGRVRLTPQSERARQGLMAIDGEWDGDGFVPATRDAIDDLAEHGWHLE